jgi:hypothetical protein
MCFFDENCIIWICSSAQIAASDSIESLGANWGIISVEFVLFHIISAKVTNCFCGCKVTFVSCLLTALVSGRINFCSERVSELLSIDGHVIHLVSIKIDVDIGFYFQITGLVLRVKDWSYLLYWDFLTGKGEIVAIVDHTEFIISKAAESVCDNCGEWLWRAEFFGELYGKVSVSVDIIEGSW